MPAGILRERVSLEARDAAAPINAYNEATDAWVALLTNLPAEVYALTGREFVAARQVQADITHKVTIRTPTTVFVRSAQRFVWIEQLLGGQSKAHVLDIKQPVPLASRPGYLACLCVEHVEPDSG